jgi:alpha-glucosidase (family GH31 glycosyl hydrolase)
MTETRGSSYRFETAEAPVGVRTSDASIEVVREEAESVRLRITGDAPLVIDLLGPPDEVLVGLGERFVKLDQRQRRWVATVRDLIFAEPEDTYFYLPLLYSSAGYAVLLDTDARTTWEIHTFAAGATRAIVPLPTVDLILFRGQPRRLVELATAKTGRPPMPPPWTFGVWKTTLGGTETVFREAERLRRERLHVSACWVYDFYDEETNSGCGTAGHYLPGPYPDLRALTRGLHDAGYRALGYVQPCIFTGSSPYAEAESNGYLVRGPDGAPAVIPYFNPKNRSGVSDFLEHGGAYVDLTNPSAAAWYADMLRRTLDFGFDGWMQDMGEHIPDDARLFDGTTGIETHNRYPLLYHRLAHGVFQPRDDVVVFARSGGLGSVPHVTAMWGGDQHCDWTSDRGLPSVLPAGPTAGLAGVAAWGPDIGGIVDGADGGRAGLDEELWLRWCQYGALTPIMRDHGGFKWGAARLGRPVDLWSSDRTVAMFRDYADLHLRLFPYFRRLAREANESGVPIIRALFLEYPMYREAWTIPNEYLLGEDLLVAPVYVSGARTRTVWFPPGEWVSWWDGTRLAGPTWADVPAPLDQIPLFQRAGSTIPMLRVARADLDNVTDRDIEQRAV